MQSKISGEILAILYKYMDLLNEKKRHFEELVGDIQEVEKLETYQNILDNRTDVYILIQEMEKMINKEVYYGKK